MSESGEGRIVKRLHSWLMLGLMLLIVILAVNLAGQSFGLWGTRTRTVTIICDHYESGKARCMSQPIKVRQK